MTPAASDMPTLASLVDHRSLGISRYVQGLNREMTRLGWKISAAPNADIVHAHYGNSSRLFSHRSIVPKERLIVTIHDVLPRHPVLRKLVGSRLANSWVRRSAATIVHSQHARELLSGDAHVIPMWTIERKRAEHARAALGIPEDALVFGLFGRLADHKGGGIIAAASGVARSRPNVWLVACGHGVGRASQLHSWPNLVVVDSPTDEEYNLAMDVINCLLAMRTETVGETSLPVLEALGRHVPIIHSGIGALPETAGDAGMVARDRKELEAALEDFVASPALRGDLQAAAATKSQASLIQRVAQEHDHLFRKVLEGES